MVAHQADSIVASLDYISRRSKRVERRRNCGRGARGKERVDAGWKGGSFRCSRQAILSWIFHLLKRTTFKVTTNQLNPTHAPSQWVSQASNSSPPPVTVSAPSSSPAAVSTYITATGLAVPAASTHSSNHLSLRSSPNNTLKPNSEYHHDHIDIQY